MVDEPTVDEAIDILFGIRERYEEHHHVKISDEALRAAVDLSVRFALNTIIGGMGTALGPFLGSILITTLETYLRATFSGVKTGFAGIYLIIYGTVLILVVRFVPDGLTGFASRLRTRRAQA